MANQRVQESSEETTSEAERTMEGDALGTWEVTVFLLGAGAERLEAETKRSLIRKLIKLSCLILDDWTSDVAETDFCKIRDELQNDRETVEVFAKSNSESDIADAKRTIAVLVDVLEYSLLAQPFRLITGMICEEARDNVLAESIVNTTADGPLERLLRSMWLSDIDTSAGAGELHAVLKDLPKARFLRLALASHLMTRVYWRQWKKDSRLKLLSLAQESMQVSGISYDKAGLQRLIEREQKADE